VSVTGALVVGVTLAIDFARGYPIVSFMAACVIAAILYWMWVRAGRPRGVAQAERIAEVDEPADHASSALPAPGGDKAADPAACQRVPRESGSRTGPAG
jgi:type III secretory pathway component EscV